VPQLNVALVPAPDQVVVRLTGEADLSTAPLLTDALAQAAGLGSARVVVDVAAARFWDCSGLHALADFTADLARAGRHCRIVGASAATRRLVVTAGFGPQLALDGPLHATGIGPEPAPPRAPDRVAGPDDPPNVVARPPAGPAAAGRPEVDGAPVRGRLPVPEHTAPFRRRDTEASGRCGALLTLRRWR
jgi:anti-anti-sigma factor